MQHASTYAIEVRGRLPAALALELSSFAREAGATATVLTGPVIDTAALYGLLARLEALGVELISVRPVPGSPDTKGTS